MLVTVVFIGIISVLGNILIRMRVSGKNSGQAQLIFRIAGAALLLLGYLVYPLIKLAISRKREFLADASSVELTKDSEAMISALRKISGHSAVPCAKENIAMFFIDSPKSSLRDMEELAYPPMKGGPKPKKSSIRDTHPSIEERVKALKNY